MPEDASEAKLNTMADRSYSTAESRLGVQPAALASLIVMRDLRLGVSRRHGTQTPHKVSDGYGS